MLKSIVLSVFGFATVTAAGAEGLRLQALNETPLLMAGSERVTYLDVSGREGWSVGGCGNVHQAELRDGSVTTAFRLTRDKRIVWRLGGPDRNRMCVTPVLQSPDRSGHDRPWGALGIIDRAKGVKLKFADPFPRDESHFLAARQAGRGARSVTSGGWRRNETSTRRFPKVARFLTKKR